MKRFFLALFVALAFACVGGRGALALSTQTGEASAGPLANIADPDEQVPPFLRGSSEREASDHFESDHAGQGFISQDVVQQSIARGNGSYLPSDPNK